jgi:hypothetical protein
MLTAVTDAAGALPGLNPVLAERLIEIPIVLSGLGWTGLGYQIGPSSSYSAASIQEAA